MLIDSRRLAERLYELAWSYSELADRAGVSSSSVSRWLSGGEASPASVAKIAAAVDVSVDWLVGENDNKAVGSDKKPGTIIDRLKQIVSKSEKIGNKLDLDLLMHHLVSGIELRLKDADLNT